jgi:type IV secretory pathway VirB4 component
MMNLAEYRRKAQSLADYLPWAALVEKGVVLNKDGSFQRTARFRGPDLDSATPAELVAITSRLNNALRRLGSGWAIFIEAQRVPANRYPHSQFPDPISRLVDAERKAQFEEEGAHFESRYFLTLLWLPPADDTARAENWLYEGRTQAAADWHGVLESFIDRTDRVLGLVEGFMPETDWLGDAETLTYLHSCISTKRQRVRVPETPMYLDAVLADEDLAGGFEPRLGTAHLRTLTVMGFPSQSWPGLLDDLNQLAFAYRWSTRAICLDKTDAARVLVRIRRQWFAKRKSVLAILKEVMTNEASVFRSWAPIWSAKSMSPPLSPSGMIIQVSRTIACAWSKRSYRAGTSPAFAKASMPSKPGSAVCPAMSMPMSVSHQSRPSTSHT